MADENLNPRRDELRQTLNDFMVTGHERSLDRMMEIMDKVVQDAKMEAIVEAETGRQINPSVEIDEVAAELGGMSAILRMVAEEHPDNEAGRTEAIFVMANLADTLNDRLSNIRLPK